MLITGGERQRRGVIEEWLFIFLVRRLKRSKIDGIDESTTLSILKAKNH